MDQEVNGARSERGRRSPPALVALLAIAAAGCFRFKVDQFDGGSAAGPSDVARKDPDAATDKKIPPRDVPIESLDAMTVDAGIARDASADASDVRKQPDAVVDAAVDAAVDVPPDPVDTGAPDQLSPRPPREDCGTVTFPVNQDAGYEGEGYCRKTVCRFAGAGMQMAYCLSRPDGGARPQAAPCPDGGCPQPPVSWAVCDFSKGTSVGPLDIDGAEASDVVVEVGACLGEAPPPATISIWFGLHPRRKRFTLLDHDKWKDGTAAAPGECRTLFFHPDEAYYPDYEISDGGLRFPDKACAIRDRCGVGGPSCSPDGGLAPALSLAVEFADEPTAGTVRLLFVRYHSASCGCQTDDDCTSGRSCIGVSLGTRTNRGCAPDAAVRTLCLGCPKTGTPCQASIDGGTCTGEIECVGGKQRCNCSP